MRDTFERLMVPLAVIMALAAAMDQKSRPPLDFSICGSSGSIPCQITPARPPSAYDAPPCGNDCAVRSRPLHEPLMPWGAGPIYMQVAPQ